MDQARTPPHNQPNYLDKMGNKKDRKNSNNYHNNPHNSH